MVCPRCGHSTSVDAGACAACCAPFGQTTVATGVMPIDTTGLPPGATFGATTGAATVGPTGVATVWPADAPTVWPADAPTVWPADAATAGATRFDGPTEPVAAGPLQVGQAFSPRYRIIRLLGLGGMGAVYQAWDAELSVAVALKVIRPEVTADPRAAADLEKRFKNELLLARQVTHKNVVRIHDLGDIEGIKYITMSYIEGADLATVLKRTGKLPVPAALNIARQGASGLLAAHEAGVVHRDLKPANIMIEGDRAIIMDFGIARSTSRPEAGTAAGIFGTLEYMAPEQAKDGDVDQRADIYAFGLILYEMLVGRRQPSGANSRFDDMKARIENGLPPLRAIDPEIPETIAELVAKCLEPDPAARYQTSTELVAALNRLDDNGEPIPEPRHLTPRLMAAAAILVIAMVAGTYFLGRRAVPVSVQHEPMPVLITDFENRSGDPVFEGAIEQTLTLAMEGAPYISVFRTKDARALAAELAPGKGDRITRDIGQLIARREGLKVLLSGAIDKTKTGFRLTMQATDPAADLAKTKPIATMSQDVGDKARILSTVASMARQVREALGESKTEMAKVAAAETFTAGSLEAMRAYTTAQDLLDRGRYPEAVAAYQQALVLDPKLGRAYAGMGVAYRNLKQDDNAKKAYGEAIKLIDRMTEREKYRTLGGYYFTVVHNYEKAVENYETLFKLFPADKVGLANLAFAHLMTGNVQRALLFGKQASDADPKSQFIRYNYAMYAMYAGEFDASKAQAPILLKNDRTFYLAWLPLAQSTLSQGSVTGARDAYAKMAAMGDAGRSLAGTGEADIDMYLGRYREAVPVLRAGIALDEKSKDEGNAAVKYVALAEASLALGQKKAAVDAANKAASLSRQEAVLFPAARVLMRVGQEDKASAIASALANMLQTQTASDADLIRGEIALQHNDVSQALEDFRAGEKRYNSWFSHYLLGTAYAGASHFSEALTEFEMCVKRRGEANDVFFADTPTLRYLPPVYYWLARSQEAMGVNASAKSNYDQFIKLRGEAVPADPLVADARTRLRALAP